MRKTVPDEDVVYFDPNNRERESFLMTMSVEDCRILVECIAEYERRLLNDAPGGLYVTERLQRRLQKLSALRRRYQNMLAPLGNPLES